MPKQRVVKVKATKGKLTDAKALKAIKKVKEDRPLKPGEGNQNARKWTDITLDRLAREMLEAADHPSCWSLCHVANECDILPNNLLALATRFDIVCVAYAKVKAILSARYSALAASGNGHAVFVMKMIPYYNAQFHAFDLQLLKDQERIKGNEKIRTQNALVNDNKEVLTDIVTVAAKLIQDTNAKTKIENS